MKRMKLIIAMASLLVVLLACQQQPEDYLVNIDSTHAPELRENHLLAGVDMEIGWDPELDNFMIHTVFNHLDVHIEVDQIPSLEFFDGYQWWIANDEEYENLEGLGLIAGEHMIRSMFINPEFLSQFEDPDSVLFRIRQPIFLLGIPDSEHDLVVEFNLGEVGMHDWDDFTVAPNLVTHPDLEGLVSLEFVASSRSRMTETIDNRSESEIWLGHPSLEYFDGEAWHFVPTYELMFFADIAHFIRPRGQWEEDFDLSPYRLPESGTLLRWRRRVTPVDLNDERPGRLNHPEDYHDIVFEFILE